MKQFFLSAAIAAALTSSLSAQDATVYIGHGINGTDLALTEELPVDVTVNGAVLLAGFEFRSFTDALTLPPGNYSIQIGLADVNNPGSQPALIDVTVPLVADENTTILAHLDDMGNLVASKFENDTTITGQLKGNVQLQHTAWAPAVDIRARWIYGRNVTVIPSVTNGAQAVVCAPAGVYGLDLVAAGTTARVLGPVFVAVLPDSLTSYYVVGSLANDTLEIISLSY